MGCWGNLRCRPGEHICGFRTETYAPLPLKGGNRGRYSHSMDHKQSTRTPRVNLNPFASIGRTGTSKVRVLKSAIRRTGSVTVDIW